MPAESIVTMRQMSALLSVVNVLRPFAYEISEDDDDGPPGVNLGPEMDGGVKAAAHSTLIRVMGRLDSIVADDSRWSPDEAKETIKIRRAILKMNTAQRVSTVRVAEPGPPKPQTPPRPPPPPPPPPQTPGGRLD